MDDEKGDPSFREATADVAPLGARRRDRSRALQGPTAVQLRRRAQATAQITDADAGLLTLGEVTLVLPQDIIGWKRNGVQDGVFKSLRRGRYPIEGTLDLHRKTVKEARAAMLLFTRLAQARGWRSVLISHGRGERSPTPARIKSYVAHWLAELTEVLAFHSAEARHGGAGSVYVLLRKSAAAREVNRERHGRKGEP